MLLKHRNLIATAFALLLALAALLFAGCDDPDTSAPQRTVINRSPDWHGALLFIADAKGPDPAFGSVRIYDNVSGFVEKTVEQTAAAAPSDALVTPDGGTLYAASSVNGKIAQFHWDGNGWNQGSVVETPANQLFALSQGPDGLLYAAGDSGGAAPGAGLLYRINPVSLTLDPAPVALSALTAAHGVSWSAGGDTAYVSGAGPGGKPQLLIAAWPSGSPKAAVDLPGTDTANKNLVTPDGRFVYVMCRGEIVKVDAASGTVAGSLKPAPEAPDNDYYGGALSADGRYLFTAGTPATGPDSTLYVIDLSDGKVVKTVKHISIEARGIQRTE